MKQFFFVTLLLAALLPSLATAQDTDAKGAFEAAKELGTLEAWNAFLAAYPKGFHADLARAYVKKLGGAEPEAAKPAKGEVKQAAAASAKVAGSLDLAPTDPGKPAVARGAKYMGFPEKFN